MWFIYLFRWPGVRGNKQILNDYIKLYAGTIETIVKQEDPQRPFMMSSPSNGVKTEQEGGLAKSSNPQSTFYGDSKLSLPILGNFDMFCSLFQNIISGRLSECQTVPDQDQRSAGHDPGSSCLQSR